MCLQCKFTLQLQVQCKHRKKILFRFFFFFFFFGESAALDMLCQMSFYHTKTYFINFSTSFMLYIRPSTLTLYHVKIIFFFLKPSYYTVAIKKLYYSYFIVQIVI